MTALACGPGLGDSLEASELLEAAIASELPLLLDADALNLVASEGNLQVALASRRNPAILTPHPAEAARLLESGTTEVQGDRVAAALEIAERYHCHVALKGCGTVIAAVNGHWWINSTGNPGMATAGMGDVLSGLIVALLAQGWPVDDRPARRRLSARRRGGPAGRRRHWADRPDGRRGHRRRTPDIQ